MTSILPMSGIKKCFANNVHLLTFKWLKSNNLAIKDTNIYLCYVTDILRRESLKAVFNSYHVRHMITIKYCF